nr:protein TSS [Ipomoea batatas]
MPIAVISLMPTLLTPGYPVTKKRGKGSGRHVCLPTLCITKNFQVMRDRSLAIAPTVRLWSGSSTAFTIFFKPLATCMAIAKFLSTMNLSVLPSLPPYYPKILAEVPEIEHLPMHDALGPMSFTALLMFVFCSGKPTTIVCFKQRFLSCWEKRIPFESQLWSGLLQQLSRVFDAFGEPTLMDFRSKTRGLCLFCCLRIRPNFPPLPTEDEKLGEDNGGGQGRRCCHYKSCSWRLTGEVIQCPQDIEIEDQTEGGAETAARKTLSKTNLLAWELGDAGSQHLQSQTSGKTESKKKVMRLKVEAVEVASTNSSAVNKDELEETRGGERNLVEKSCFLRQAYFAPQRNQKLVFTLSCEIILLIWLGQLASCLNFCYGTPPAVNTDADSSNDVMS